MDIYFINLYTSFSFTNFLPYSTVPQILLLLFYILSLSILLFIIFLFTFINNVNAINNNQAVKKPNIREINNKEDAIKYAIVTFIKPLNSIPKK